MFPKRKFEQNILHVIKEAIEWRFIVCVLSSGYIVRVVFLAWKIIEIFWVAFLKLID